MQEDVIDEDQIYVIGRASQPRVPAPSFGMERLMTRQEYSFNGQPQIAPEMRRVNNRRIPPAPLHGGNRIPPAPPATPDIHTIDMNSLHISESSSVVETEQHHTVVDQPKPTHLLPPTYSVAVSQPPRPRTSSLASYLLQPERPPPSYNTTYGLYAEYVGTVLPTTPSGRFLSPRPVPIICPTCGNFGISLTRTERTIVTHLSAVALFLCACWPCCILPYFMDTCKDSYHYCPNCQQYLGAYTPW